LFKTVFLNTFWPLFLVTSCGRERRALLPRRGRAALAVASPPGGSSRRKMGDPPGAYPSADASSSYFLWPQAPGPAPPAWPRRPRRRAPAGGQCPPPMGGPPWAYPSANATVRSPPGSSERTKKTPRRHRRRGHRSTRRRRRRGLKHKNYLLGRPCRRTHSLRNRPKSHRSTTTITFSTIMVQ
jgi:hypothetical protein